MRNRRTLETLQDERTQKDTTTKEKELERTGLKRMETDSEVATLNNFIESQNESIMMDLFFNEDLMRQSIGNS